MEPIRQPGWSIYKEQMDFLCLGHALWEPAPTSRYTHIGIGDIGFIRRGQFYLLFSAGSPLGERELGVDVPATFKPLDVGIPESIQSRPPCCLRTSTVREVGTDGGAIVSATPPLDPGTNFSYELTDNHGAALVTKYRTYRVDSSAESAFERYTKRYYESWVTFARDKDYGDDVHPVLVSGFDVTRDFAIVAYYDDRGSSGANSTIAVPAPASTAASLWGTWRTTCSPHTNCGPHKRDPLLQQQAIECLSPQSVEAGIIPDGFDQCIFIRYYTMRPRKRSAIFPKTIQAGAGPRGLGSGGNGGGAFTESTAPFGHELTTSGDGFEGQLGPNTEENNPEPYIVAHKTQYGDRCDSWDVIADYVFQNSDATSALMHHRDFVGIRRAGGADDLSTLLAMHGPRIVVDESGVGRIVCQEIQPPEAVVEGANTPTPLDPQSTKKAAVPAEAEPSPVSDIAALTTKLDSLRAGQDAEALSKALRSAITERELYKMYLSSLAEDEARAKVLLEVFDKALTVPQSDVMIFKKFRQLCGRAGSLPVSHIIPGKLIKMTEHSIASGAFGDVWEGIYNGNRVAIKALRVYKVDDVRKARKLFCKEVAMWRGISHPNIVPFLGASEAPAPLSMVSEWMPNGNVRGYVKNNPEASRLQLLLDICRGLSYLHSLDIVHGDLKGGNILMDKSGCARLNDFGLTSIACLNCTETSPFSSGGTYGWMAPEILGIEQIAAKPRTPTPQSDVFALGMVAIEVFTGQVPFPERKGFVVALKIVGGERPPRPPKTTKFGLSDELWAVVQSLWAHEASDRPPLYTLVDLLEKANPEITLLKELMEFNGNSEEDITKLRNMFDCGDNALFGMREDESLFLIEIFDRVLNSSFDDAKIRGRCLRGLQKVSARCGLLPKSHWVVHSSLTQPDVAFSTTGRVSNICKRLMNGRSVAVKTINPECIGSSDAFKQKLCTNAIMWKRVRHPNVLSFLGLGSDFPPFSLVYPWMPNGTLTEYLRTYLRVDKLSLLLNVTQGLAYLHQYNMIHGNLTGNNVLVDADGVACVSEYGVELVLCEEASTRSTLANIRWMAPEVITIENRNKRVDLDDAKRADVYSLAMVMFEILTGTAPFSDASDEDISAGVITGLRPEWPSGDPSRGLIDALSRQVEACWCHNPEERPTASTMLQYLQALVQERAQERHQDTQEPLQHADDETWDYVEDARELALKPPKGHTKHHNSSSSTLAYPSIDNLFVSPYHSDSSTSKLDLTKRNRVGVEKRMRNLFRLSKPGLSTAEGGERRKPEVEIVDQREDRVQVSEGSVPYLTSKPIPDEKKLKKVVITVVSKDQGWLPYQADHGNKSWTWFELSVGPSSGGSVVRWRGEVVRNHRAHSKLKEHIIEISDKELYEKAESGDVLTVWAHARLSGWKNTVKKATIRCVVE